MHVRIFILPHTFESNMPVKNEFVHMSEEKLNFPRKNWTPMKTHLGSVFPRKFHFFLTSKPIEPEFGTFKAGLAVFVNLNVLITKL